MFQYGAVMGESGGGIVEGVFVVEDGGGGLVDRAVVPAEELPDFGVFAGGEEVDVDNAVFDFSGVGLGVGFGFGFLEGEADGESAVLAVDDDEVVLADGEFAVLEGEAFGRGGDGDGLEGRIGGVEDKVLEFGGVGFFWMGWWVPVMALWDSWSRRGRMRSAAS